jgi:hypothetical protein
MYFFTKLQNYSAFGFFAAAGFLAAAFGAAALAVTALAAGLAFGAFFTTLMPATLSPFMALMAALKRLLCREALFL